MGCPLVMGQLEQSHRSGNRSQLHTSQFFKRRVLKSFRLIEGSDEFS